MFTNNEESVIKAEIMLKSQLDMMINLKQHYSAEKLISLWLSTLSKASFLSSIQKQSLQGKYLELLGDVSMSLGAPLKAIDYYKQAFANLKHVSSLKTPNKAVKVTNLAMNSDESRVKYKESKCYIQLKDFSSALQELEIIPMKYRDAATHMALGNLYKNNNMKKQAVNSFKEGLRLMPLSLEAIDSLAALGESYQDITSIISDSSRHQAVEALFSESGWLFDYVHSLTYKRNGDYDKMATKLQSLHSQFPQNSHLLLNQGLCAVETDKHDQAFTIYKQLRSIDPQLVEGMDKFALVLHQRGDATELNKLSQDVLNSSPTRPIGWLVVALYCDLKGHADKAMSFVDRAITQDYKYAMSYVLKGKFLLSQGHPKQAAVSYFQANILQKDLMSLSGLIDANLDMGRFSEAVNSAKEALVLMPKSSTAYTIMGKVLAKNPKGQNESIRAFTKALKINPMNHEAALNLSTTLEKMSKCSEAIECLKEIIGKGASNCKLRIQLAKLLTNQGKFVEAITELHSVAAISPKESEEVTQELEKVETLLRGDNTSMNEDVDQSDSFNNDAQAVPIEAAQSARRSTRDRSYVMSSFGTSIMRGPEDDDEMGSPFSDDEHTLGVDRELFSD